jgi:predicted nucleic-acid-binding protein
MLAVDTNILVRLAVRDDAKQAQIADEFVSKGAWVSHLVLAEALWVLVAVYEFDHTRVATTVDILANHNDLTLQDVDVVTAALRQFRARPAVGFSDCLILEIARKAGHLPLGTFDRDLAKLDGSRHLGRPKQK